MKKIEISKEAVIIIYDPKTNTSITDVDKYMVMKVMQNWSSQIKRRKNEIRNKRR